MIKYLRLFFYIFFIILLFTYSKSFGSADKIKKLIILNKNPTSVQIPIFVHILDINEKRFKTVTDIDRAIADINKTNEIWSDANIYFDIKEINFIKNELKNFPKDAKKFTNLCEKRFSCIGKNAKKTNTDKLIKFYKNLISYKNTSKNNGFNIYYLPKTLITPCGMALKDFIIIGQKNSNVGTRCRSSHTLAHELGHFLSLPHVSEQDNLMYGDGKLIQSQGFNLTIKQKKRAFSYYKSNIKF